MARHILFWVTFAASFGPAAPHPVALISPFTLTGVGLTFTVKIGEALYTDRAIPLREPAPELHRLTGIRVSHREAVEEGVPLEFELGGPARILVSFFRGKRGEAAEPPADGWNSILHDAVIAPGHPRLTVYSHQLPAGPNSLNLGKGACVVLGFVIPSADLHPRIVFFNETGSRADLDWLFE